jgi:hypothetical protein
MTRKITQLRKVNPGDYDRWRKEFNDRPFVRSVLAKFERPEAESIRWLLFEAQLGPQQFTREDVRLIWPELADDKVDTRINVTDYVIAYLTSLLKRKRPKDKKTHRDNVDIAVLLTAAGIPGGKGGVCGWSAETIKKRRERVKGHTHWEFLWGPRLHLRRLFESANRNWPTE